MEQRNGPISIPEQLFHTTLTVVDYHEETLGPKCDFCVLGTHTTASSAKNFALKALEKLGYQREDFAEYATQVDTPPELWKHGNDILVYARAPSGKEFMIGLQVAPNTESLPAGPQNTPQLPEGQKQLHYVLHCRTDYSECNNDTYHCGQIQGCYLNHKDALFNAKSVLRVPQAEYFQYDERESEDVNEGWPFGEDVIVHAVGLRGEHYNVAVKTVDKAHTKHHKR
ncbi:uncharacterized protein CTHT_0021020 [Thermochaetoides thermophila DSM 1495]|uniref:Uncharacterized protein n=1 Tax=Chaetomium thermophilum (strain DSM 1495 / CBS 144.50 / IMI 039719) TaxID=759272 RepID=G0S3H1_CHATD|nr:hypothetical protein CTHT_0021020 [Thermochaetoides thermophila DSM 1495]EGS22554.1 hypothetical protein CTHT_0021020 [Thermochaetoides thermophila DSM 1495]